MKLINTLNEAIGVPSGILDTSKQIYDKIISSKVKYIIKDDILDSGMDEYDETYYTTITGEFKIGGEVFTKITYLNQVIPHPNVTKMDMVGMSVQNTSKKTSSVKIISLQKEVIVLDFKFVCPGEISGNESIPKISDNDIKTNIKNILITKKNIILSTISHELKHAYDSVKKREQNIIELSKYNVSRRLLRVNIPPIESFCFSLYFLSMTENLVRPTELASLIDSGEITKGEFLSFLKNNETYKILNDIKNMSYEKLRNDLFKYINEIKKYWENDKKEIEGKTDEQIVDLFLTVIRLNLQHNAINYIYDMLLDGMPLFLAKLFNREQEVKFILKAEKKIMKYNNNKDFYTNEINNNIKEADFLIRKLAKLYSIAK